MRPIAHLANLDLNLLVALRELVRERSVTRAAQRLGVTQPAASASLSRLRRHFAGRVAVLPVLHRQDTDFEQQLSREEGAVLVDSRTAQAVGGTGTSYNWLEARSIFLGAATHLRLIVAGGLAPENVKQAIQILRPWGVDVVSGVESAPGKKDPARVLAFIRSAQEAVVPA